MDEPPPERAPGKRLALVIGASGGIGRAISDALIERGEADHVVGLCRSAPWPAGAQRSWLPLDLTDEAGIAAAAPRVAALGAPSSVIVASGLLHAEGVTPEKTYRALSAEAMAALFAVNAIGPTLVAKHMLPIMPRRGRSTFAVLSARVGSIQDNRLGGWYGYRASKAALNMLVHSLAIEHRRTHPEAVCVALHPGTVRTALSAPFRSEEKGGAGLLDPPRSAQALLDVLAGLTPANSGGFFAWDGAPIPW